jgi:hypothetical protein
MTAQTTRRPTDHHNFTISLTPTYFMLYDVDERLEASHGTSTHGSSACFLDESEQRLLTALESDHRPDFSSFFSPILLFFQPAYSCGSHYASGFYLS